jgi:SP family sugar:H+ symporter-like MFS transporter
MFGDRSFLFNVIVNVVSLCAVITTWFYIDTVGRRPALLFGGSMMAAFLSILAGMGSVDQKKFNHHEQGAMVASVMLFQGFFNLSWAPV